MAQQQAAKAPEVIEQEVEEAASENVTEADKVFDADSQKTLFEFLRGYSPNIDDRKEDMITDRFRINLAAPLPDLDTKLSKAYTVEDISEPENKLYALVCPKNLCYRSKAITKLKNNGSQHMVQLVTANLTKLSQPNEERFVVVFERPVGMKLSDFVEQNLNNLSNEFICERIIAPVASAIHHLQAMDIPHGCVNPDNIYINQFAILGPCVTEPCGYSQNYLFEPIERMQAMPAGKGKGSAIQDYHALAVTVLYVLFGPSHFNRFPNANSMARTMLREGPYNALIHTGNMSDMFLDLFRGVFSHNSEDRWEYESIRNWLDGKRYHALSPPTPAEASRPFEFMGNEANTRRELVHLLTFDWESITDVLLNNKLSQWVAASLRNKELADQIIPIARTIGELSSKNETQLNDQLSRLLMIMDPDGPVRIKHMSFHVDGLEDLYCELYAAKAQQDLQSLLHIIEFSTVNEWIEIHRKRPDYTMPSSVNTAVMKQDRLRPYLKMSGLGFGVERVLYDLNPELPCQSPLLDGAYVNNLEALLKRIDAMAPNLAKEQDPIDAHIAAYIASKINMQHEIQLRELSSIPELSKHRTIVSLFLLSSAQARTDLRLPGLTHWIALRIFPILDPINSRTIRHDIKSQIMDKVSTGYLQRISQLVINANYIKSNTNGFKNAVELYQFNQKKIRDYKKSRTVEDQRAQLAYSMAKIGSYMALLSSIFIVLQG